MTSLSFLAGRTSKIADGVIFQGFNFNVARFCLIILLNEMLSGFKCNKKSVIVQKVLLSLDAGL